MRIDRYSLSGLRKLEFLDLSLNPIGSIQDYSFAECIKLKYLYLEGSNLKIIHMNTFKGKINNSK